MKTKYCSIQITGILWLISLTFLGCSSQRNNSTGLSRQYNSIESSRRHNSTRSNEYSGRYIIGVKQNDHKTKTSILAVSEKISNEIYAELEQAYRKESDRKDKRTRLSQKNIEMDLSAHPLTIMTFTDSNKIQSSVDFGRTLTECLITSFEQKGFGVIELRKTNEIHIEKRNGEYFLSRNAEELSPDIQFSRVLAGTYSIGYDTVIVNARLIEVSTGKIVASNSLEMKIDENIWYLLTNGGTLTEMVKKLPADFVDADYYQRVGVNTFERKPNKL